MEADGRFRYLTAANRRRCVGVYLRLYFMFSPCRMQTIASRPLVDPSSERFSCVLSWGPVAYGQREGKTGRGRPFYGCALAVIGVSTEIRMRYCQLSGGLSLSRTVSMNTRMYSVRFSKCNNLRACNCPFFRILYPALQNSYRLRHASLVQWYNK